MVFCGRLMGEGSKQYCHPFRNSNSDIYILCWSTLETRLNCTLPPSIILQNHSAKSPINSPKPQQYTTSQQRRIATDVFARLVIHLHPRHLDSLAEMHNIFPSRNHQEISRTLPSSLLFDISTPEQYADGPNRSRRNGIAASKRRRSDINVEQRERASGEQSINFSKSGGYSGAADTKIRSWAPQSYATESPPRNVAALIDHREDALYPRVYVPHSATHPRTLPPIRSSSVVVDSSSQLSAFHPISSVSRVSPPRTINYTRLFYNTSSYGMYSFC